MALTAGASKKALVAAGGGSPAQTSAPSKASGYKPVVLDYGKQVCLIGSSLRSCLMAYCGRKFPGTSDSLDVQRSVALHAS